ncbi:MAG: non-oxidative hydroxyarylic acid decarboxylases subunit D [Candidatus Binataceae bacterium]
MTACPRCRKSETRTEYQGEEAGKIVWTVLHCNTCGFTWRDSEPAASIAFAERDRFFDLNAEELGKYPIVLPPVA